MPFPAYKKKITFDDIDCPEYWCEFKTMTGMKYAEVKDLFGNTEEIPDSDYVETLLGKVIMAWNLPEVEGGEVLPIPATDVQSIHKLPNIIITHLVEQITGTNLRTQTEDLEVTS